MQRHFEKELESLKTSLIKMGSITEQAIGNSIKAFLENDAVHAEKVIDGDERVNALELEIDHAIMDLMALQQPVASDLRFILAAQKINNDLERIGDHAVNIAESALAVASHKLHPPLFELPKMVVLIQEMLRSALDGFIHLDPQLAKEVLKKENEIDELNRSMAKQAIEMMKNHQTAIEGCMELIRVSRNLERVADLATNIAEEIIFVADAKIIKHHAKG